MKQIIWSLLILSFCCPARISAQEVDLRRRLVLERFDSDTEVKWVKYFRGYLDHRYAIDLLLASDGEQVHGAMRIELDSIVFYLDGAEEDGRLLLDETDEDGAEVAFLVGNFDGSSFQGVWKNKRGDIQFPLQFSETRQFKKLEGAAPRIFSFDTKATGFTGHWSVFCDDVSFISGTFIDEINDWYQIRPAGRQDNLWKVLIVHQLGKQVYHAYLDLDKKQIYLPGQEGSVKMERWLEYPIFSYKKKTSYSDFICHLEVNKEYKRLKLYIDSTLQTTSHYSETIPDPLRGNTLSQHFINPIFFDHEWLIFQWVSSSYYADSGHHYDDLLVHFRIGKMEVLPFDQWWNEYNVGVLDPEPVIDQFLAEFEQNQVWFDRTENQAHLFFERLVFTPRGTHFINHYNTGVGSLLIPAMQFEIRDWVSKKLKKKSKE